MDIEIQNSINLYIYITYNILIISSVYWGVFGQVAAGRLGRAASHMARGV
jgi:hypothetical protein